jgi:cobalt-precorrin 5A hydrolase
VPHESKFSALALDTELTPAPAFPRVRLRVSESREPGAIVSTWVIGIGCRRGVSVEQIHAAVFAALGTRPLASTRALASIDSKKDETALLEFAAGQGLPLQFFSKQHIAQIGTGASERVQALLGIDGVCEPCALLASHNGRIIVPKTVTGGVTVAIAEDDPNQQTDNERTS